MENATWARVVFGPGSEIQHRTYAVLAKGIRKEDLKGISSADIVKKFRKGNRIR